jgi:predicted acyltransferase
MSDAVATTQHASHAAVVEVPQVVAPTQRLMSLDVFRGITIAGMLLVNNPGSWSHIYAPLRHAEWNGWTPTDLIFPFFLFIVGVAMAFSFGKLRERGAEPGALLAKSAKRALILFGLGLLLHSFPWWGFDYSALRIPGVLQRIAVAFLVASAVILWTGWRGQGVAAAVLLFGYWAAMRWVPVPGVGAGVWEPGQDLGAYLDRAIFGVEHLWSQSRTWDPEGLLSTVPAIATVLLGVLAGHWLRSERGALEKTIGLFLAGNAGLVAGVVWGAAFPINKPLWTSSYALFTAGMALHFLAVCYWLIDVKGYKRWSSPFMLFGVNAIAAYFLSSLTARILGAVVVGDSLTLKGWLYETLFTSWLAPINASLAFATAYVLLWLGVMAVLYRQRIFIKI